MDKLNEMATKVAEKANKVYGGEYEAADVQVVVRFGGNGTYYYAQIGRMEVEGLTVEGALINLLTAIKPSKR